MRKATVGLAVIALSLLAARIAARPAAGKAFAVRIRVRRTNTGAALTGGVASAR